MPPKKQPGNQPKKQSRSQQRNLLKKPAKPLEAYKKKRDFIKTSEPADDSSSPPVGNSFVIQEHHARSHHFDFRLEINGVLVSWAVPKSIPSDPSEKKLAVHVEDHPLSYGSFEGEIPKGNYGAGQVTIWDSGTWEPLGKNWEKKFAAGKLKFNLHGQKANGTYVLARMGEEPNWLLRKITDAPDQTSPEEPTFIEPQLARPIPTVPTGPDWIHELKLDGYRLIAARDGENITLFTRNGHDWTEKFHDIATDLLNHPCQKFVLDGEAVVFDEKGRTRFGDLQAALKNEHPGPIQFVAFDLLNLDGQNLRDLPLKTRAQKLAALIHAHSNYLHLSKIWPSSSGPDLFRQACKNGLEGIISKKKNDRYHPGTRRDWVKSKCRARQEFVICGFTHVADSKNSLGALVLASYENGLLIPCGKVGTGFRGKTRAELFKQLSPLATEKPENFPADSTITWIRPDLVAEVEFAELTREGSIRQGSFLALREDKAATDIHLDRIQKSRPQSGKPVVAEIPITHPDRLVFSVEKITKLEVVRYYEDIAPLILPYLIDRPLSLLRAPDGITGQTFFQKSFPTHIPPGVSQKSLDDASTVITISEVKGLIALIQFGVIEIHPWGSKIDKPDKPDFLIWDLDPDATVEWPEVLGAAFLLRDLLAQDGLEAMVKTSGGKGLHLYLRIRRSHDWDAMKTYARDVSVRLAALNPKKFLIKSTKAARHGKIFIDWMRNGRGSTCVAPWSLRARPGATVSMPITWETLAALSPEGFNIQDLTHSPTEWTKAKAQNAGFKLL